MSLDGVREDMQNIDNTLSEVRTTLFAVDNDVKLVAQETTKELERLERGLDYVSDTTERLDSEKVDKAGDTMTGRLVTDSPIWIHPGGQGANGEHNMLVVNQAGADTGSVARFQQNGEDILKIEHAQTINACGNHITNLADPEHEKHAVTKQWAEEQFALKSDVPAPDTTSYLPLSGGKLTGDLQFASNKKIDCNNSSTVLSGRGCLSFALMPTNRSSLALAAAAKSYCFRFTATTDQHKTTRAKKRISPLAVKHVSKRSMPTAKN